MPGVRKVEERQPFAFRKGREHGFLGLLSFGGRLTRPLSVLPLPRIAPGFLPVPPVRLQVPGELRDGADGAKDVPSLRSARGIAQDVDGRLLELGG